MHRIYIGVGCLRVDMRGEIPIAALAIHMGIARALAACLTSKSFAFPIITMQWLAATPNLVNRMITGNKMPP